MVIELDMESEVPIYVQLRNQIVKGIGKGELKAQEKERQKAERQQEQERQKRIAMNRLINGDNFCL